MVGPCLRELLPTLPIVLLVSEISTTILTLSEPDTAVQLYSFTKQSLTFG